jgi:hypothetical protein
MSEMGQSEKNRHRRGTAGQPPTAEMVTDRPTRPVGASSRNSFECSDQTLCDPREGNAKLGGSRGREPCYKRTPRAATKGVKRMKSRTTAGPPITLGSARSGPSEVDRLVSGILPSGRTRPGRNGGAFTAPRLPCRIGRRGLCVASGCGSRRVNQWRIPSMHAPCESGGCAQGSS